LLLGTAVVRLRDGAVGALALAGIGPNLVTWTGLVLAAAAGACFAVGAGHAPPWEPARGAVSSWWPIIGGLVLLVSAWMDMLDGALARAAKTQSGFGALLDSTLDRFADLFVYLGCAVYFALAGNVTYVVLCMLATGSAFLVSYVKARAENLVSACGGGYWQRGERLLLFVGAALAGHVPAGLWLLAVGPLFTVAYRIRLGRAQLSGAQGPGSADGSGGARGLAVWRYPRGSLGYDLCTAIMIAFLLVAPWVRPVFTGGADPLRSLIQSGGTS
jgi:CDP-diacylglycerol--glycerol-3-phosphate 3-phosphatidyltransferase